MAEYSSSASQNVESVSAPATDVDRHNLSIYLNDHLAGAAAALELLDALAAMEGCGPFAERLRLAVTEDRQQLESLMKRLSIEVSTARRVASWLSEKLAELKVGLDDRGGGSLKRLELLEALALGVEGKKALWRGLDAAASAAPWLSSLDYARLTERATQQRQDIEAQRVNAAADALAVQFHPSS
jgi:hypothetical protein